MAAIGNVTLNKYLIESPDKKAFELKCKAFAFSSLEKISYVAMLAITAVALFFFHTGVVLAGPSAYLMVGLIFGIVGMMAITPWFIKKSIAYRNAAEEESRVAEKLKNELSGWSEDQVKQFLTEQGINPQEIPLEELRQLNRDEPLRALLPLIARYLSVKEEAEKYEQNHRDLISSPQPIRNMRLLSRQTGWHQHEALAIPCALKAACFLQMMLRHSTPGLELENQGYCLAKTFEERMFDRMFQPFDDTFFRFHPRMNRAPLTLDELERDLHPAVLRLKLYPNRV